MKTKFIQCIAALVLLLSVNAAQAAITCTISSPGFGAGYTSGGAQVITPSSYSITCTRGLAGDALTTTYAVAIDNGQFANGVNNRAASGANRIRYDLFANNTCATSWKGNTTIPATAGTITMSGFTPTTATQNFWGCIAAGLTPVAGTYSDTVTMTPTYSAGVVGGTGTFPVNIITPPVCTMGAIPNITLVYDNAFRVTPATATTNAPVTCSNTLSYTLAVSPVNGVSAGINYALSLPANGTGTGVAQAITITATAAAGQAGTCATATCTGAPQTHTLTVTY